jgi:hypothetical protein
MSWRKHNGPLLPVEWALLAGLLLVLLLHAIWALSWNGWP